jgi:hypothetical protein
MDAGEVPTACVRVASAAGCSPWRGAESLQAYWRLLLTVIAALIFFSCAGALVFRKESSLAAMPRPVQLRRLQPVRVTVDPDEAWRAHLAWLESSRRRAALVA